MEKKKKSKCQLLIEPGQSDQHLEGLTSVRTNEQISDKMIKSNKLVINSEERSIRRTRQKSELASILMILFGSILLICAIFVQFVHLQTSNRTQSNQLQSLKIDLNQNVSTTTTTTIKPITSETTTTEETSSGKDIETESGTTASELDEEAESDIKLDERNKLGNLILSSAGEASDLIMKKLTVNNENTAPENVEDEEEEDSLEEAKGNKTNRLSLNEFKKRQTQSNTTDHETDEMKELKFALETYEKWRTTGDEMIELFSRKLLPIIIEHGYDVDALTVTGVLQVFNAIRGLKPWALKLLDSWSKLSPGILVGTQSDFGDFDECLNVRVDDPSGLADETNTLIDEATGLKTTTVYGRYCLADVEFPKPPRIKLAARNEELNTEFAPIELRKPLLNFSETAFKDTIFVETANFFHMLYVDPIRVGICLTNKIEPESFSKVFNILVKEFKVSIDFKGRCVTKYDQQVWTIQQKVSALVLIVVYSLVVLCTVLDLLHTKLNKMPLLTSLKDEPWRMNLHLKLLKYRPIFTSFSIIRNTKRLFKPHQAAIKRVEEENSPTTNRPAAKQKREQFSPIADSISSESSPSIERRSSSVTGSALNLISDSLTTTANIYTTNGKSNLLAQFNNNNLIQAKAEAREKKALTRKGEANLLCLHGIRVITMTWMIVNHTYLFGGFFVLWAHRRLIDIAEWPKSLSFQLVLNGWLTVETYFFLSATIIVLNVMPLFKAKKFAYLTYILHRLVRLLPAYTGLICLNFLWPLISSGPVWLVKGKSFIQSPCENYLWTNFLFINNWIWPEKQCMVHTWFLSADLQLYLLAPIIVYLLYRRPVFGHSVNIIVAIIASIVSGLVIYANKLLPTTLINKLEFDSIKQQLSYSYFATYQHMGPYCLGIFIGYLLHKRPQVKLPKHLTWLLWLLLPPLSFTTLLLTYLWNGAYSDPDLINPSPLVSAFYVAIHRTIWTSLVAWIVFACATGRAKLMSNFLSHPMFIPLSRLSFSIYLVHLPIIMFRALNLRHTIEWTDANILWEACGNFIVSLIMGYFLNVAFESPFINLEAVIFKREPKQIDTNSYQANGICKNRISNGENTSDDEKSAETSSEQQTDSSPDQDGKNLESNSNGSDKADTKNDIEPESSLSSSSNGGDWTNCSNNQYQRTKKLLRPKHNSVERIFGHQLEPQLPPQSSNFDQTPEMPTDNSLNSDQQMAPLEVSTPIGNNDSNDSIYPMTRDFLQQHPRIRYQDSWSQRPVQYATLARTSRFDHDALIGRPRFSNPYTDDAVFREVKRPRSNLESFNSNVRETFYEHEEDQFENYQVRRRASSQLLQGRRQGRYNTLTGSLDWRPPQYKAAILRPSIEEEEEAQKPAVSSNWLLAEQSAGIMIPRIDSSTLRRQTKRFEANGGGIVEEPRSFVDAAL